LITSTNRAVKKYDHRVPTRDRLCLQSLLLPLKTWPCDQHPQLYPLVSSKPEHLLHLMRQHKLPEQLLQMQLDGTVEVIACPIQTQRVGQEDSLCNHLLHS